MSLPDLYKVEKKSIKDILNLINNRIKLEIDVTNSLYEKYIMMANIFLKKIKDLTDEDYDELKQRTTKILNEQNHLFKLKYYSHKKVKSKIRKKYKNVDKIIKLIKKKKYNKIVEYTSRDYNLIFLYYMIATKISLVKTKGKKLSKINKNIKKILDKKELKYKLKPLSENKSNQMANYDELFKLL